MTDFVSTKIVESFFYELHKKEIPHILLRNLNQELPNRLKSGKDIDILIHKKDKKDIITILKKRGMKYRHHNRTYLYAMDQFDYYINPEQGFAIDVSYQLACQSPNKGEWVPLDRHLQELAWSTRLMTEKSSWESTLSPQIEIIHLVSRCIFDKRHFNKTYTKRIEELKLRCNLNELVKLFELIFFKFTPILITMLENSDYKNITNNYLTFSDY